MSVPTLVTALMLSLSLNALVLLGPPPPPTGHVTAEQFQQCVAAARAKP